MDFILLNINYLKTLHNLTNKEFGNIFNVTGDVIASYSNKRAKPQIEFIKKVCEHFEIKIDDFVYADLSKEAHKTNSITIEVKGKKSIITKIKVTNSTILVNDYIDILIDNDGAFLSESNTFSLYIKSQQQEAIAHHLTKHNLVSGKDSK